MTRAENIYSKITSYANYRQMNGIEKEWILKCIEEGIKEALTTSDVSNRRELLIAYTKKLNNGDFNYIHEDSLKVDTFLNNL